MNKIIICLDNNNWATTLTLNKEYIVTKEDDTYYYFTNDKNVDKVSYYKSRFKVKEMKPKLNLADKTQNWCVQRIDTYANSTLLRYLKEKYAPRYHFDGTDYYYGVLDNKYLHGKKPFGREYTIEEFLEALQEYENLWQPKCGDIVEVETALNNEEWTRRPFIAKLAEDKYICTAGEEINSKTHFTVYVYKRIRKVQPKVEISITCTVNGKTKDPKDFTDDEWLALKK